MTLKTRSSRAAPLSGVRLLSSQSWIGAGQPLPFKTTRSFSPKTRRQAFALRPDKAARTFGPQSVRPGSAATRQNSVVLKVGNQEMVSEHG